MGNSIYIYIYIAQLKPQVINSFINCSKNGGSYDASDSDIGGAPLHLPAGLFTR